MNYYLLITSVVLDLILIHQIFSDEQAVIILFSVSSVIIFSNSWSIHQKNVRQINYYLIVSWIHQKNVRQKRLDNYIKIINCYNEQRPKWLALLRDTKNFEYNVYQIESNEYRERIRELVKIHEIMCDQSPKIMSYTQIYRLIPRNDLRDHNAIYWFNANKEERRAVL